MARRPRLSIAGELHYVVQTGHNGQAVFADDADRHAFLAMLRDAARSTGVTVHAYALLDNAVHLLAVPGQGDALGRLMQSLGRQYVSAYNRRHGRSGSLWAGRFRCAPLDDAVCGYAALLEVETAPVVAGQVADAAAYTWSSAGHHLGKLRDALVSEHASYWAIGNTPFERESAHAHNLAQVSTGHAVASFAAAARQGRPVGSRSFIERLARGLPGLPLAAARRGRPKKSSS